MPTAKPAYKGQIKSEQVREFSGNLKEKLRQLYPTSENAEASSAWRPPADDFVSHMLSEAIWAISQLHWFRSDITKSELRAELKDLLNQLSRTRTRLEAISPDLARLLPHDADPRACADLIKVLVGQLDAAGSAIDQLPIGQRLVEKQAEVMREMTIRVLRVLQQYGINPAAHANPDTQRTSEAVTIIKAIGDDIGLCKSVMTWRDVIAAVKKDV